MEFYAVCDQDGFSTNDPDLAEAHFLTNPTHTSHLGAGGMTCVPMPYSGGGSSTLLEVETDPVSPVAGQVWLKANGSIGAAGQAMGVMGLTYTKKEVDSYDLSVKTAEGKIVRLRME